MGWGNCSNGFGGFGNWWIIIIIIILLFCCYGWGTSNGCGCHDDYTPNC